MPSNKSTTDEQTFVKVFPYRRMGFIRQRQKPLVPTPRAPIRNRQTREVANDKVHNRQMIGRPIITEVRLG